MSFVQTPSAPSNSFEFFSNGSDKTARYYQVNAINVTIEAIAKGQDRILLVMATGTGKTYTAFQIIWRLWKAGRKKRILFLADRNMEGYRPELGQLDREGEEVEDTPVSH